MHQGQTAMHQYKHKIYKIYEIKMANLFLDSS